MIEYNVCPFCSQTLKIKNYENHIKKAHSDKKNIHMTPISIHAYLDGTYSCSKCNRDFVSLSAVMKHCSNHPEAKKKSKSKSKPKLTTVKVKCPYCNIQTENINSHFKDHHKFQISYQDYLDGKKKKKLFDLENENIPKPITRASSDKVNCPVCQVIISADIYNNHFRTDHKDQLISILEAHSIEYFGEEGFSCPESKFYGKTHSGVFVQGRFSSNKLKTKIPKFFCYTCGKTYIAEEKYTENKLTSKKGNIIYNYPDLLSNKIQKQSVSQTNTPSSALAPSTTDQKVLGEIKLIVYDKYPKTGCNFGEHKQNPIVIKTFDFSNYQIEINAFYCEKCNKFFTNYESVKRYFGHIKPYISIHCEYTEDGRRDFSELSLFGYNVDAKDLGYKENKRRKLLQEILDNRLIEKITIINLLKSFININGKGKNMGHARDCWEDDLDFVSNYTIPNTKVVNPKKVSIIYKNKIM